MKIKLQRVLTLSSLVLVGITALSAGLVAYIYGSKSVEHLWKELSRQLTRTTEQGILQYLEEASSLVDFSEQQAQAKLIDLNNNQELAGYLISTLQANMLLTHSSYLKPNGSSIGTLRGPEGIEAVFYLVNQRSESPSTKMEVYNDAGKLKTSSWNDYNSLERPYWKSAMKHPEGSWTEPFITTDLHALECAYFLPSSSGGLWGISVKIDQLSHFLSHVKRGEAQEIFVMSAKGRLIAGSNRPSEALKLAQEEISKKHLESGHFAFGEYMGYLTHLTETHKIPWTILIINARDTILEPVRKQAMIAFLVGALLTIVALLVSYNFFKNKALRLQSTIHELEAISNLNFGFVRRTIPRITIIELDQMQVAIDKLKIGLASMMRYLPIELISSILASHKKVALNATHTEMTALVCDIVNFTHLSESLPIDELIALLEKYLEAMGSIIHEHKGIVDKYIGDAILALWGAPSAVKDHPYLACQAALKMKEALKIFEDKYQLKQRIGINTGEMIIGNIGSENRMEYTVIGKQANFTYYLEEANKTFGTEILLSAKTALAVEGRLKVRKINEEIYELIG